MTKKEYIKKFKEITDEWIEVTNKYINEHEYKKQLDSPLVQIDKEYAKKIKILQ